MLSATGIKKNYGKLAILKGVDLQVASGEIVTIVGASGAGKSSLLNIIGTLDTPDQGEVVINKTELRRLSAKQISHFRNRHIGFIFQFHHLLAEFSALENVCLPAYISGKSKNESEKRATELLDMLGLKERLHHRPNELSGGEQQRVSVARALVNRPTVIMADEPSGNLDSKNASELHRLFVDLRKQFGQTFIIVTHNEELAGLADRTLHMKDGRILNPDEEI